MSISTYEGIVENGVIRLRENVTLPEKATVYVVIPDTGPAPRAKVYSPRLVHREQAADFVQEIIEGDADADL
jgi:hypothetical protein